MVKAPEIIHLVEKYGITHEPIPVGYGPEYKVKFDGELVLWSENLVACVDKINAYRGENTIILLMSEIDPEKEHPCVKSFHCRASQAGLFGPRVSIGSDGSVNVTEQ